ncbi:MAG: TIGR00725 family protein [Coriobacteriia bacterium]|nr:TIGR00725 family protein [Coriobacteriia bacterium]
MRTIIGVMGGGEADANTRALARQLGRYIAEEGWVTLSGGRDAGVMSAVTEGAHDAGGLTVGVLPDDDTRRMAPGVDIPILTGMGDARNVINVLSSHIVIALAGGAGTLSEVALALKNGRPVITIGLDAGPALASYRDNGLLRQARDPRDAIEIATALLADSGARGGVPSGVAGS